MNFIRKIACCLLVFLSFHIDAQSDTSVYGDTAKESKTKFKGIKFNGFVRTWFFYRDLDIKYEIAEIGRLTYPRNISLGDGYDQPLMYLQMEASPFPAIKITSEIAFDNRLMRGNSFNGTLDANGRMASAWQIFNFKAETFTDIGTFKLTAGGGANWYRMSPFTMWSANDFNTRDDMFERLPWEPQGDDFKRYASYYNQGDIPRDQRWGNSHTQGVLIEGVGLPAGFNAAVLVGKAAGSAGFQSYQTKLPLNLFAFRAKKSIMGQSFAFNYIDQFGHNDNVLVYKEIIKNGQKYYAIDNKLSQLATTLEGEFLINNKINFDAEIGFGSFMNGSYNNGLKKNAKAGLENASSYKRSWNELINLELSIKDFPVKFQTYRVGKYFVNFSSAVQNASVDQSILNAQNTSNTASFDGLIPMIGQMTSNRQGVNAVFSKGFGALKTKAAYGISQEVQNLAGDIRNGSRNNLTDSSARAAYSNSVTFQHTLNNLSRSRFGFWQRFGGPYNRIHNVYRRSFENIAITDSVVDYKKSYTSFDLELKYKFILFGRPIIVSNYVQYNSVQDKISPLPKFNNDAFVRLLYNEFTAFYNLKKRITLIGMFGYQTVRGNERTELADGNGELIVNANDRIIADKNGKPMHQIDFGYGAGIDYNFHDRASIHLRQRWYSHKDLNFTLDKFRGNEATVELKVFF
jgi:hypothetical protein